jgi:hypothetical protein
MKSSETVRNVGSSVTVRDVGRSETFILYIMNGPRRLQNLDHVHASKTKETLYFKSIGDNFEVTVQNSFSAPYRTATDRLSF